MLSFGRKLEQYLVPELVPLSGLLVELLPVEQEATVALQEQECLERACLRRRNQMPKVPTDSGIPEE